jgi:hypothetical protein
MACHAGGCGFEPRRSREENPELTAFWFFGFRVATFWRGELQLLFRPSVLGCCLLALTRASGRASSTSLTLQGLADCTWETAGSTWISCSPYWPIRPSGQHGRRIPRPSWNGADLGRAGMRSITRSRNSSRSGLQMCDVRYGRSTILPLVCRCSRMR